MPRLLRLLFVSVIVAVVVVTTATADPSVCTHGVSSVGPVVLRHGEISGSTASHTEACLP
jgi:hypothetical protein